jgi:hypothetical protein
MANHRNLVSVLEASKTLSSVGFQSMLNDIPYHYLSLAGNSPSEDEFDARITKGPNLAWGIYDGHECVIYQLQVIAVSILIS